MDREYIESIFAKQKEYFKADKTLLLKFRKEQLQKLKQMIVQNTESIYNALHQDLGKSSTESFMTEVGLVLSELNFMLKNLKKYMAAKTVKTPIMHSIAKSHVKNAPLGNVLIISPWNYPILLAFGPLINAIAAGNTCVIKPSEFSVHTSKLIKELIAKTFNEEYIAVVDGDAEQSMMLLELQFNHIFFTGSTRVGKIVMQKASEQLIPVTLELGGKSPCIVDSSANIKLSAKRIVFGKFLNVGQTCVAPDYIYCHKSLQKEFINCLKQEIEKQYTDNYRTNQNYGKIINRNNFDRILSLINKDKIVYGGDYDAEMLKIEPVIMENISRDDACMKQEIFGPILPIITFENIDDVIEELKQQDEPLALYIFSRDKSNINKVLNSVSFGGGCVNDCLVHLSSSFLPFGGVGQSGMGSYHGQNGFETFSNQKSILNKHLCLDIPIRYAPYSKTKDKLLKLFVK